MFWRNLKGALAKEGEALAMEAMFVKRAEELFESLLEQSNHFTPQPLNPQTAPSPPCSAAARREGARSHP